jgi:hypothetical protein
MNPGRRLNAPSLAFGWLRGLAYALLWALAIGALEGMFESSPVSTLGWLPAMRSVYPLWLLYGAGFAVFAALAVPALPPLPLMCATAAVAVLMSLFGGGVQPWIAGPARDFELSAVYLAWRNLVYGGLFVGACALAYRAERARTLLGRAEVARSRSQALFSQAQLAGLQGSVDPVFLLRVLGEMQRRYGTDAASADRLLDHLVDFLRLAMPGVRSGQSTLGAEVAVVRSYARLTNELDPVRARWQGDIDPSLAELPFPPLLLLPLFDQLDAGSQAPASIALSAVREPSKVIVALHGAPHPGWLEDDLLHRLRVGLKAIHGSAADVLPAPAAESGAPALRITLPPISRSPRAAMALLPTPQPKGASTWMSPVPTTT